MASRQLLDPALREGKNWVFQSLDFSDAAQRIFTLAYVQRKIATLRSLKGFVTQNRLRLEPSDYLGICCEVPSIEAQHTIWIEIECNLDLRALRKRSGKFKNGHPDLTAVSQVYLTLI